MSQVPSTQRARLAAAGAQSATAEVILGRRSMSDVLRGRLFHALLLLAISLAVIGLGMLILDALVEGQSRLGPELFTEGSAVSPADSGFKPAIYGTVIVIGGVVLMTVPLGVGAALYLEEYANRERWWNRVIELNIQNLAAVPSIVYGILGLAFFVRGPLDLGFVAFAGSLTLTLLVLPTVIIAGREAIRAVPPSIREGALALGATQWQTVRRQVLPASIAGIVTGVILAISRAIGETAPLLLVGAATLVTREPTDPFTDSYTVLPVQIFQYFSRAQEDYRILAAAGIIVMLIVLLLMNSFAIWLRNRYEQRW